MKKNIADPRTDKKGVFTDAALQSLYDQLIVQGMESRNEAIKAGITIEERDIADLSRFIRESEDDAIIQVLEDLKKGSENHLRAFTRQL
jgi:hypothetical protein